MSIQDFYKKFVSATENNALVDSLRRLSLFEDPKAMLGEEPNDGEWIVWTDAGEAMASVQA
jgi:hypothetical protein